MMSVGISMRPLLSVTSVSIRGPVPLLLVVQSLLLLLVYFQTSIYGENIHIQDTMYISQIKMCSKASSG